MAVRADRPVPLHRPKTGEVKDAIAQIGLGGRADHNGCTRLPNTGKFGRGGVGGVHQVPVGIDGHVLQQPHNRAQTRMANTVFHFLGLLRDMDVHGKVGCPSICCHLAQGSRIDRPQ